MKPIVVPVNFSDNSNNAARYAADMALAIQADIHLIHVLQIPLSVSEVPMPEYIFEDLQQNGQSSLKTLAIELQERTRHQVIINTEMVLGGVEGQLEEFCARIKPFVVVMGASAHSMETLLAGNNTIPAMRRLPFPLLVIPGDHSFHAIRKIALACDQQDILSGAVLSLPIFKELRDLFSARLEVLNVASGRHESEGELIFRFNTWKEQHPANTLELHLLRADDISKSLNRFLRETQPDWLAIFPKHHSFLEFHSSQAKKLLHECSVPVMSIPPVHTHQHIQGN